MNAWNSRSMISAYISQSRLQRQVRAGESLYTDLDKRNSDQLEIWLNRHPLRRGRTVQGSTAMCKAIRVLNVGRERVGC